jgi:hypothetical protein
VVKSTADLGGARTLVLVPMLKESELLGTFVIYRTEVRPFTDKQPAKRVELVRESFPQARQLGLLWDASSRDQVEAATTTAKSLDFEPRPIEVTGEPPDYAAAFGQMADVPGEPVVIPAGPIFLRDRTTVARLLLERRIPSIAASGDRRVGSGNELRYRFGRSLS